MPSVLYLNMDIVYGTHM